MKWIRPVLAMGENMFKRFADTIKKAFPTYGHPKMAEILLDKTQDMVGLPEIIDMFVAAIKNDLKLTSLFERIIIICINRNCLTAQLTNTEIDAEGKMLSSYTSEGRCKSCGAKSSWCRIAGGDIKLAYHDAIGTSKKWRDEVEL